MAEYRILNGTPQAKFGTLRKKVQVFGGGYGNGKTAAAVVQKVLSVARDYPGANILVARSTYPKLNDTIRKEFLKWCPKKWIKSFPTSKGSDNTCVLKNGTYINFRYISQQGKGASQGESTTSNLLSATYDLIVVDQMEDPEIVYKDFTDLLGRLRGDASYIGSDTTMPLKGPRWMVICVNPTRNWLYQKLIAPLKKYEETLDSEGEHVYPITKDLLCKRYPREHELHGEAILDKDGKAELIIELVEGSTYTNAHNLGADFIETLESVYQGQQKDRYLYGDWASYEGLVHPDYEDIMHELDPETIATYFDELMDKGITPSVFDAYDFGLASPACYILAFADRYQNVFLCDGWYEKELNDLEQHQKKIWEVRNKWGIGDIEVRADPAIHKRTQVSKSANSKSIATLFGEGDNAVNMGKGDNAILAGITKVNSYLALHPHHRHPITRAMDAPHLYVSRDLTFISSEFASYMWKQDPQGARLDEPIDANDHAMNTIKYLLSKEPAIATRSPKPRNTNYLSKWSDGGDIESNQTSKGHRYG